MSLIWNESALYDLLESPDGPVGRELRRVSENVTQLVRDNATKILEEMNPDIVQYHIGFGDDGLQSIIGVEGTGRWSSYLAAKEEREAVIFAPALEVGLHI
jgi:hypothetical protein